MIGQTVSHYRILEKIGHGGMGVVYKARDLKLDRLAALKFLPEPLLSDENAKRRFVHEARAASALDHQNIGTVYEIDELPDGRMFIAMAFYEGLTIKGILEKRQIETGEAVRIALGVAQGLAQAHKRAIIHRDIKPSNIIATSEGGVKIVDFGLAKLSDATKVTRTAETTGTPAYMSPEQVKCQMIDHRSDIFSLGIVMYEMLSGSHPFDTTSQAAVLQSIINDEPKPLSVISPRVTPELEAIVKKALEKDVTARYQTAEQLVSDLSKLAAPARVLASTQTIRVRPKLRGRVLPFALGVPAAVALIAYLYFSGYLEPVMRVLGIGGEGPGSQVFTIAVAPFSGETQAAQDEGKVMQGLIAQKLKGILSEEEVRIVSPDDAEPPHSHTDAKTLGRDLGASTVIWGEVVTLRDEVEIAAHISDVRPIRDVMDTSFAALQSEMSNPDQLELRKAKAREVGNLALLAAAKFYLLQDPGKALAIIQKLPSDNLERFLTEAWAFACLNQYDRAAEACREASRIAPEDPRPYIQLGSQYEWSEKRFDEAFAEFQKAVAVAPDDLWPHLRMAGFYSQMGKPAEAKAELERVIALEPKDAGEYSYLAQAYSSMGRHDEAIIQYGRGVTRYPGDVDLRCKLASLYESLHRYEDTVRELEEATEIAPKEYWPAYQLAWSYLSAERFKDAIPAFRKAIDLNPADFSAFMGLGHAHANLGRRREARKAYDKAIMCSRAQAPGGPELEMVARIAVGCNYRELGWYDDAVREMSRAGGSCPDDNSPHYFLSLIYQEMGKYSESLEESQKVIDLGVIPEWLAPHLHHVLCLYRVGKADEAEEYLGQCEISTKDEKWPRGTIPPREVLIFYRGEISENALLEKASAAPDSVAARYLSFTAHYYVAMAHLLNIRALAMAGPDTAVARAHLEKAVATMAEDQFEYPTAKAELAHLAGK